MSLRDAYHLVMDKRDIACINHQYAEKLIEYEKTAHGKNTIKIEEFQTTRSVLNELQKNDSMMMVVGKYAESERLSISKRGSNIDCTTPGLLNTTSMRIFTNLQETHPSPVADRSEIVEDGSEDVKVDPILPEI